MKVRHRPNVGRGDPNRITTLCEISRFAWLVALVLVICVTASRSALAAGRPWTLERVVVLERHGIRAPTSAPSRLDRYSSDAWPAWPVAPGDLTEPGRRALSVMAAFMRARYVRLGLLPSAGCPAPGRVFVWADGTDERTRASGRVMARGLAPGCGLRSYHIAGRRDPLFHAAAAGVCPSDGRRARAQLMARVQGDLNDLGPAYEHALGRLQAVLVPHAQSCFSPSALCALSVGRNRLTMRHGEPKLTGPLAIGATLSEDLLLEYADGLPPREVGWGRTDSVRRLAQILVLHERYADLTRRTPYMAVHNGVLLARLMLRLLADAGASGPPRQPLDGGGGALPSSVPIPPAARLVLLVGHDTNLSNVGAILGLDWRLAGEPDSTAPDTALALELWRGPGGARRARAVILFQTLAGLRDAALAGRGDAATGPRSLAVAFPGCTRKGCPLAEVRLHARAEIGRNCGP